MTVALVPEGTDYFRTYRTSVRLSIEFFMAEPLVLKLIIRRRRTCETACDKTVLATAHYLQQNSLRPSFSTEDHKSHPHFHVTTADATLVG